MRGTLVWDTEYGELTARETYHDALKLRKAWETDRVLHSQTFHKTYAKSKNGFQVAYD